MNAESRVIVGIDGSDSSRVALRWALAEAVSRGATLEVVHAWRTPMLFVPGAYDPDLVEMGRTQDAALRFIDHELDAVGADGDCTIVVERTAVEHFPARALTDASRHGDLVVLGRHGATGFPHELLTPKVVQVAHHAHCPVAVVPDAWDGHGRGIVVGVDGSEHGRAALRWAADEAKRRSAALTAVMAFGLLDQHHADPAAPFDPHYSSADARAALAAVVTEVLGAAGSGVDQRVVNDLPARALLDAAVDAELLVVGARGLGGFADLLLGSVSHRCLAHSPCPAVAIR